MTVEMFYGMIIIFICLFCGSIVLSSCIAYHKGKKDTILQHRGEIVGTITEKELQDLVMQSMKEDEKPIIDLIKECLEGKHNNDPKLDTSNPYVSVSADCLGYECEASPNREDCCHSMGHDGKCHLIININQLCGVEDAVTEIKKHPDVITQEMVDDLAYALTEYERLKNMKN